MSFKDVFNLQLWQLFCSVERNRLGHISIGPYGQHLCEIILNLGQQFKICSLFCFIFSSGGHFVWQSGTFWAFLETFLWNYFKFGPVIQEGIMFKKMCKCNANTWTDVRQKLIPIARLEHLAQVS